MTLAAAASATAYLGATFVGFACGSVIAVPLAAVAVASVRGEQQRAFVERHGAVTGTSLAFAMVTMVSGAGALVRAGALFAAGRVIGAAL